MKALKILAILSSLICASEKDKKIDEIISPEKFQPIVLQPNGPNYHAKVEFNDAGNVRRVYIQIPSHTPGQTIIIQRRPKKDN